MKRVLRCELSDAEVALRRERLVSVLGEVEAQEAHFAELKAEAKAVLKDLDDTQAQLLREIREHAEQRPVECEERRDERRGEIQVIRTDTGEVVESRAMTASERQLEIEMARPEGNTPGRVTVGDTTLEWIDERGGGHGKRGRKRAGDPGAEG